MPIIASTIVEVCVFRFRKDAPEFLLLQRSPDEKIYPGLWQLVGGSIDDDEKAYRAALRELKEETGFVPMLFWVVPHVSSFYDPAYDSMNLTACFAAQVEPDSEPVLSGEHQRYEWLRFESARQRLVWPGQRQALLVVHDYVVGGEEAERVTRIPL